MLVVLENVRLIYLTAVLSEIKIVTAQLIIFKHIVCYLILSHRLLSTLLNYNHNLKHPVVRPFYSVVQK